jgi:hypothetical protein
VTPLHGAVLILNHTYFSLIFISFVSLSVKFLGPLKISLLPIPYIFFFLFPFFVGGSCRQLAVGLEGFVLFIDLG